MFRSHSKWHLWHCRANWAENSICWRRTLGAVLIKLLKEGNLSVNACNGKAFLSLFVCVCSDYGTICVSIHELGCILNSISTQISLSYRVWDGGLVRNTVHHSEGQTWTSSWIFAGLSAVASNCWKVDEELCPRTPLFQITETVFFVCPAACSICVSFLAVCNTASYVV